MTKSQIPVYRPPPCRNNGEPSNAFRKDNRGVGQKREVSSAESKSLDSQWSNGVNTKYAVPQDRFLGILVVAELKSLFTHR